MTVYLKNARHESGFIFSLEFSTGEKGLMDLREIIENTPSVKCDMFRKNPDAIKNFYLDSWPTLAWDNGFDICPDVLYGKFKEQSKQTDKINNPPP